MNTRNLRGVAESSQDWTGVWYCKINSELRWSLKVDIKTDDDNDDDDV